MAILDDETESPTDVPTEHCRAAQLHPPVFNILSDRRGTWRSTPEPDKATG